MACVDRHQAVSRAHPLWAYVRRHAAGLAGYVLSMTVILAVGTTACVMLLKGLGWRVDSVLSGSMEPDIRTGSVVLTRPAESLEIQTGDVIVFRRAVDGEHTEPILIAHRVVDAGDGTAFRTKGDANKNPDPFLVPADDVVGVVVCDIPYLGRLAGLAGSPYGISVLGCCLGMLVVTELAHICRRSRGGEEDNCRTESK